MSKTVIHVEHLSKAYRIGVAEKKSDTIAGALLNAIKSPIRNFKQLRNLRELDRDESSVSWALKDINFEVKEGEVLGIIGHNGAGKSTLLKILSRITEPTEGRVTIHGRVSSLLEVGTGFHPDLTGRENIYMNGTILGMRKREIDSKLDEIIAFSGVDKYIDTPVKRYSSGMTVRLAFSVAAHLEPEILIIDEVLAVGDAEFQAKCLGKMNDVAKQGRTVLFVSHNMAAVQALCYKGIHLVNGGISGEGKTSDIIKQYLGANRIAGSSNLWVNEATNNLGIFFSEIKVSSNMHEDTFKMGDDFDFLFSIQSDRDQSSFQILIKILDQNQNIISCIYNTDFGIALKLCPGENSFKFALKGINLLPGVYSLSFSALYNYGAEVYHNLESVLKVDLQLNDVTGTGVPLLKDRGVVWFTLESND